MLGLSALGRLTRMVVLLGAIALVQVVAPASASAIEMPCGLDNCVPSESRCISDLRTAGTYVAGYSCNTRISTLTYYKGWASIMPSDDCTITYYASWSWNGTWTRHWVLGTTRVYVGPFTTDWSWVWTADTGWRAMRDVNLIVNSWDDPTLMHTMGCPVTVNGLRRQYLD